MFSIAVGAKNLSRCSQQTPLLDPRCYFVQSVFDPPPRSIWLNMSVKTVNLKHDIHCLTNVISKLVNNTKKTHLWGTLSVLFQTDLQVHSHYRTTSWPVRQLIRYLLFEGTKQVIYGRGQFINRAKFARPLPPPPQCGVYFHLLHIV